MNLQDARRVLPELNGLSDQSALNVIHQVYYPNMDIADLGTRLGVKMPEAPQPERTWGDVAKDVGITAVKGAISVPEAAVGMADIVSGGNAGKALEGVGFRPKEAKAILSNYYSDKQKRAFEEVSKAEGFMGTMQAAIQNPSVIAHAIGESVPSMLAGGVIGRGVMAVAPRAAGIGAAAVGEGTVAAGSAAEQIRQQTGDGLLTGGQSALAATTGVATGVLGALGGKVAQKLGIADVDTMLVGAAQNPQIRKGVVKSALEGALSEGVLEELPQSISEQVLQNQALGKPLDEGVDQAAVLGLLSGASMGAGANVLNSFKQPPSKTLGDHAADHIKDVQTVAEAGPMTRAANIATNIKAEQAKQEVDGLVDGTHPALQGGRDEQAATTPQAQEVSQAVEQAAPQEQAPQPQATATMPQQTMAGTNMADLIQGRTDPIRGFVQQANAGVDMETGEAPAPVVNESLTAQPAEPEPTVNPLDFSGKTDAELQAMRQGMQVPAFRNKIAQELQARRAAAAAAKKSEEPAHVPVENDRYGIDHTPFSAGGKPFKTKLAADRAKKMQPMMRVVPVEGGFALADKTAKQIAAQAKAAKRFGLPTVGKAGVPLAAHEFIATEGGLTQDAKADLGIEKNVRVGNRHLFAGAGKGLSLEQATEKLASEGYIKEHDQNAALEIIKKSVQTPQYTPDGWESVAQAEMDTRYEDHLAAQEDFEPSDPFAPLTELDMEDDEYTSASEEVQARLRAIVELAEAAGIDAEGIMQDAARETENKSEQAYHESATQKLETALNESTRSSSNEQAGGLAQEGQEPRQADFAGSQDGGQDSGQKSAEDDAKISAEWRSKFESARDSNDEAAMSDLHDKVRIALNGPAKGKEAIEFFENLKADIENFAEAKKSEVLSTYTPQEIEQRQAEQEQADAERKRQDREAEQRAKADAERDTFTLTGSDRPVDVAAAHGQGGLFDAPATKAEAEPETNSFDAKATWDAMTPSRRFAMLDAYAGAGQTDMGERYKDRAWDSFTKGEKTTLEAAIKAAEGKASEPQQDLSTAEMVQKGKDDFAAGVERQTGVKGIKSYQVPSWLQGWDDAKLDADAKAQGKVVMPSEYPTQEVSASYSGISHSGTQRARSDRDSFVERVQGLYDEAKPLAETDAQQQALDDAIKVFKDEYLDQTRSLMRVRSGTYSGFIAGRAKLNTKQADSRNSSLDKAIDRFIAWEKSAAPKVKAAVLAARTPEKIAQIRADEEAEKTQKQEARHRKDLDFMAKVLSFKSGDEFKVGTMLITKVNNDKDGYPLSLTMKAIDGSPLVDDKLNLATTVFGKRGVEGLRAGKEKIRSLVDAIRAEKQQATKTEEQKPSTQPKPRKAPKAQEIEKSRADYFAVGNVVQGYGGFDEVLGYTQNDDGTFNVNVHAVKKVGDDWVRIGKPQDARNHSTQPDARQLKAGPVAKLDHLPAGEVKYTEPRADGKPFPNAVDRGTASTQKADEAKETQQPNFYRSFVSNGWNRHERESGEAYEDNGGRQFLTFEKDGVRLSFEPNSTLDKDRKGGINYTQGESNESVLAAIIVDQDKRFTGKATMAMAEVLQNADAAGTTLFLEPKGLEDDSISNEQLTQFYETFGFSQAIAGSNLILYRQPEAPMAYARTVGLEQLGFKAKKSVSKVNDEPIIEKLTSEDFSAWIRKNAKNQTEQFKEDKSHSKGDEGVGLIHLSGGIESGGLNWAGSAKGTKDNRDSRIVFRMDDGRLVWWDDESGNVYEVKPTDDRLDIQIEPPSENMQSSRTEYSVTVDGDTHSALFDGPIDTVSEQSFSDTLREYGITGEVAKAFKDMRAKPKTEKVAPSNTDKPASKTPTVDSHMETMKSVRDGTASPEQYKAGFIAVADNADAVKAELSTQTKEALLRSGGLHFYQRHKQDTKPEIVDSIYGVMLDEYALGKRYGPQGYFMGQHKTYEAEKAKALRDLVDGQTAETLADHAAEIAKEREELTAKRVAQAQSIADPKTIADFRSAMRAKMVDGMTRKEAFLSFTVEQRTKYDELEAESTRETREERKRAAKTEVRAAGQTTGGEIIATKHTRDGYDLFVVQLADRVSREDYGTLLSSAKKLGGWYSSFAGRGAVRGFQFKEKPSAEAFLKLAAGDTTDAKEQAEQRRDSFEDDRSQTAVERLSEMAQRLEERANESLGMERKANTARRAGFAASAEKAANADKAMAKTMQNIADAIGSGKAKFLDAVRQKTQVEMLNDIVRTAKDAELRAKYPSYADQEKRKGEPATAETADHADFPSFTAYRSDLATLARQMLEVDGTKKLGQQLMKVADDVSDAYLAFAKENILKVSSFGSGGQLAEFPTREGAERAIKRSNLVGKAIVLPIKRGANRVILSPSEAINRNIWKGDGDKRITLTAEYGQELVQAIGRRANKTNRLSAPWQFESASTKLKALARMGIETQAEFRSALREFIEMREQAQEADRVKMLERSMVGRKKDGLDFFPTPKGTADAMVDAAEITPDMAVLEPSAGMGHLADRIREAGAEPDVIEMSGERRELLDAKGFNVVGEDFLEIKPRGFTYGDVFKHKDGRIGILGSNGGMGSRRYKLMSMDENAKAGAFEWVDREDLTGIEKRAGNSGYDRIIMNPPFSDRRDAEHVMHAYDLLKPNGRLVAIMGEGVFFGSDKKAEAFRQWLEERGGTSEKLDEGTFLDPTLPVTTGVSARMVVIDKAAAGTEQDGSTSFSRQSTPATGMSTEAAQKVVDEIRAKWANAPEVIIVESMDDDKVPQAARDDDAAARKSQKEVGAPEGFFYEGKVYIVAGALRSQGAVMRVLFHESLGHFGLRGAFGDKLDPILKQIAALRKADVTSKAQEYGLDMKKEGDRLQAAEEVLAEMAQSKPELGFVKRAVAIIRGFLRKLGLKLELTDDDIIGQYIIPARAYVERGSNKSLAGKVSFSRDHVDRGMLDALRDTDELFALPKSDKTTIAEITQDNDLEIKVKEGKPIGNETAYTLTLPDGTTARITVRKSGPNSVYDASVDGDNNYEFQSGRAGKNPDDVDPYTEDVWIDVSNLKEGQNGTLIYNIAATFAYNTGRIFIGDPNGLSDEAMRRRAENMLSSALKFGTTKHLAPHPRQTVGGVGVPALKWVYGDDVGNVERLIDLNLKALDNANPHAKELTYDLDSGGYRSAKTGEQISRTQLAGTFDTRGRSVPSSDAKAGWRTTARGAVFRAILGRGGAQSDGARRSGEGRPVLDVLVRQREKLASPTKDERIFYSRTSVGATALAAKVRDELGKTFTHAGKLSWWHKTVGSQYNLAEREPAFKKVFDAAQNFINDVSYYGSEAANMAPKILPKLETLKDLAKTAISTADNKAVAKPVFEGTLSWTRDADGKPVKIEDLEKSYESFSFEKKARMLLRKNAISEAQLKNWKASPLDIFESAVQRKFEETFLKAGLVWKDSELSGMFGLSPEQIALYKEFRAATDTSLDNMAKAQMLREGGKDVEGMREAVMAAPDVDTAAMMVREFLLDMATGDPDRADMLTDAANSALDSAAKVNDLKKQGYAPLSRFGRFTVDVVVDGERQYFGLYETERDANNAAAKMRMEFGAENVEQGTMSQKEFELFQGITPESLELFGNMLGLDATGNEAQDKAFQTYLKLTKNNRSAMKRLIHRKGVAGYSEDVGRVLASFVYANARQTSAALHIGEMDEAINEIPKGQGELKDHALELAKYVKEPQEEAAGLRGLMFAQYLGGSVASAMVNFTQPLTVSIPYLSQFGGLAKAGKVWAQAVKDMAKGTKLETGLELALKAAEESGVVSPQEVHQLMAQARGAAVLKSGDGTRAGDAMAKVSNGWTRSALAWGKLFGYAEQVNRRSTFIAAYRLAVENNHVNPSAFAEKAVNETQFINNKANKMKYGRGAIGATLMTFKSYSLNWLELMHRLSTQEGKEGKLAAAYMLGALFLVAGASGLPFAGDAEDLIDAIAQKSGYNFSSKKAKQEFLEGLFGKAGAEFVDRGITGLNGVPIDLSGRMGMSNLIPATGLLLEKRDHSRDMMELAGPVGDMAKRAFEAVGKLASGDLGGAIDSAAPRAMSNVFKGVDMANTGMYRDTKGAKVIDTTMGEAVAKMVGFQPSSVAQVQEANYINQRAKDFYTLRVQDMRAKWAQGIFEGDAEKVAEARQMMTDWNADNPEQKMTANMPSIIKRVREMKKDKAQRIADTAPKSMRAQMKAEARDLNAQ